MNENEIDTHERWMHRCIELATRGAGGVSPNPMVGAVLVDAKGLLLGEGWHRYYGGPHAEREAIADAEQRHGSETLRDATLYVNLEPCNHHGKTPPCTDIILEKGIPRVVVGIIDPFPAVAGSGIARLTKHGVSIRQGILERECFRLNEAFLRHVKTGRPLITLKTAQTLDGRIATNSGDSRWVSGEDARRLVHSWRASLDAVLVGSGTARLDNPALTVRLLEGRQPIRIVLDREGTLPPDLTVFSDAFVSSTLTVVNESAEPAYEASLLDLGGRLLRIPEKENHLDLNVLLQRLGKDGGRENLPVQSVLVEAGPRLATAFLRSKLVDRYFAFVAPKILGDGIPVFSELGVKRMQQAITFSESSWKQVGDDMLFRGYFHST